MPTALFAVAGVLLLVSCQASRSPFRAQFVPTRSATHTPPVEAALAHDPPPALESESAAAPVPGSTLTVVLQSHQQPLGPESWRASQMLALFKSQEWESWKQASAVVASQSEPLLLEDVILLNLKEDSKIPVALQRLLLTTESDLPLTLNQRVLRFVNYFTGRGRRTLRESLRRAGAYRPMISQVLAEERVPQDLIFLVQAESGFRPTARSRKRATGMWQFVAWRGREYGLQQDRHVDERLDPEKATRAAAWHLADLYEQFGDWYLAMAAYNCGPGCVQRAVERTGYADFWEMASRGAVPKETTNYVPAILAMLLVAKNEQAFNLDSVIPEDPVKYDTVVTSSRIGLGLIADATGATPARIKQLNPALLGSATPDAPYSLRIPRSTAKQFSRELAAVPEAQRRSWRRHEVRPGETLTRIATLYRVSVADIMRVNTPETAGTVPTICDERARARAEHCPPSSREPRSGETSWNGASLPVGHRLTIPVTPRPEPVVASAAARGSKYRVRTGDNLGSIARRHKVTVAQLRVWNRLSGDRLTVGQVLAVASAPAARSSGRTRTVRAAVGRTAVR